jgi:nucleotide-binding universal stress UspA family protein
MKMWKIVNDKRFKNVDLIVIGSHGTSGFNEVFIGSNTEKVIRLADSPVLTVKNELEDFVKKFKLSNYTINIYNSRNIEKGITDFSDEVNADLIAIETHGRTGIAHLINGSLAEDVANHIDCPVLSIKIQEKPGDA